MKRLSLSVLLLMSCSSAGTRVNLQGCYGGALPVIAFGSRQKPARAALVFLTGDGGWRKIDSNIAAVLRDDGFDTTGFLANDYFRRARSVEETACDLDRVIRDAVARAHVQRVLLVGYSRGAETVAVALPHMETRENIGLAVMLAPTAKASMRVNWLGQAKDNITIDAGALHAVTPILCIHGKSESESLCDELFAPDESITWRGGHHFAGDYEQIGKRILARWER